MPKLLKPFGGALRDALLSRYAPTTWITFLLILAYAAMLRAGLLG